MIIQTGMRTDIPAFFADWFANRLRQGYVCVRNPYNPLSVTKYRLDPSVVDMIGFCTKNPKPMLKYMELLMPYGQYWFVTITPYGADIEPNVPPVSDVIASFQRLSSIVGINSVGWRYDPIIINGDWTPDRHIDAFSSMCGQLAGFTHTAVISFIDLYKKVQRNFPEARAVPFETQLYLTEALVKIAADHDMIIKPCGEDQRLESVGADCSGCMTVRTFEEAIGQNLSCPPNPNNRAECACYITGDIGAYDSCGHLCRYCYANSDKEAVKRNMRCHDPASPLLIGHIGPDDVIHETKQLSWIDPQLRLEFYDRKRPQA